MAPPSVLMVGTGEYTTGFVAGSASTSDKKVGVVGLTCNYKRFFLLLILGLPFCSTSDPTRLTTPLLQYSTSDDEAKYPHSPWSEYPGENSLRYDNTWNRTSNEHTTDSTFHSHHTRATRKPIQMHTREPSTHYRPDPPSPSSPRTRHTTTSHGMRSNGRSTS